MADVWWIQQALQMQPMEEMAHNPQCHNAMALHGNNSTTLKLKKPQP